MKDAELTRQAPAKINLTLDVVGLRADGYHEVRMIMQTVSLFDTVSFKRCESGIHLTMPGCDLPCDETNLAYRAAAAVMQETGLQSGVEIEVIKRIPMAAGLAGGSTDCAAVLLGLNKLYDLDLSIERLCEIGTKLGADVPFCVLGGTKLCEGIGEDMSDVGMIPDCFILLAKPNEGISTKEAYDAVDALEEVFHPAVDMQIEAIRNGDLSAMARSMGNSLEYVSVPKHPKIKELEQVMREYGALNAMMSGSGPTVFGIYADQSTAEAARMAVQERYPEIFTFVAEPYR